MPELLEVAIQHLYYCRVCGFKLNYLPWERYNDDPTFELCPCCGVQFGVMDDRPFLAIKAREDWLRDGSGWFDPNQKPRDWQLEEQLKHVPKEFK